MSTLRPAPAGKTGARIGLADRRRRQGAVGSVARPLRRREATASGALKCAMSSGSSMLGAGGRPSGAAGAGRRLGAGVRLADAAGAGVGRAVIGQVQMDMVVVEHVRARSEHGVEILAGARVRLMQEGALLAVRLLPVVHEIDLAPVGEREARDVDRVAEGVLGKLRAGDIVDSPAAVRAEHVDGLDLLPETGLSVRLDDVVEPGFQRRDHRAIDGQNLVDRDCAVGQRRDLERTRHSANAGAVDLLRGDDSGGRGDEVAGEAGVFGLGAPDRPLFAPEESAAPRDTAAESQKEDRPNATRHRAKMRLLF